jgi:hypothetical protein
MEESTVEDEVKRQTVIFLFGIAGTIATVWVMANLATPSQWQEFRLNTAQRLEKYAMDRAKYWASVADKAARIYERNKT